MSTLNTRYGGTRRSWVPLVVVAMIVISGCDREATSLEPIDVEADTYNVQFLTPSWFSDTSTIADGHWPNTTERALEISEHAIGCVDISLLQESVNATRRSEILGRVDEECPGPSYTMVTLQHDWDVPDALSPQDVAAYVEAVVALALDGLEQEVFPDGARPEEVASAIFGDSDAFWASNPLSSVGSPTPIIHEEVGVMTNGVVVSVDQVEFTQASGTDRFAAKGVLHVRIHVTTRPDPPPARPIPESHRVDIAPCTADAVADCADPPEAGEPVETERAGGTNIDVFVTHLNADGRPHSTQIAELISFVDAHWSRGGPLLVAGDFNIGIDGPAFLTLCSGLQGLDGGSAPAGICDGSATPTASDLQVARVGATNRQGWDTSTRSPSTSSGRQIDHVFTQRWHTPPTFDRNFNPLRPFDPPTGLVAGGFQTLSDHAEIDIQGGQVTPARYPDRAPVSVDRVIQVDLLAAHAGIDDGCDAPDVKGTARLRVGSNEAGRSFGPTDDLATLTIGKSFSLPAAVGVRLASLHIDLTEHDALFCGADDELDIDPHPGSTNAAIDLDLTWDGGIQLNGEGLGWYGQETKLVAGPNWFTFKVTVAAAP